MSASTAFKWDGVAQGERKALSSSRTRLGIASEVKTYTWSSSLKLLSRHCISPPACVACSQQGAQLSYITVFPLASNSEESQHVVEDVSINQAQCVKPQIIEALTKEMLNYS